MQKSAKRVLLLEDSAADVELIYDMLAEAAAGEFQIHDVSRLRDALDALATEEIDFILTDLRLPDSAGLATLLSLRQAAPQLPIIIFSNGMDERQALEAVQAGAQDYLVKGRFDGQALVRAIRYASERRHMESEVQRTLADLENRVQQRTAELEAANSSLQNEVAERIRAEVSLRRSEHRLLQYLEAMPVGITVADAAGRPYYINRMAKQLFGITQLSETSAEQVAEAYGIYRTNSDQLYPHAERSTTRALAGELSTMDDMEIRNGSHVTPIEASGAPIYDEAGNVELAISVIRDISERKRAEQQLRESEQRFRAVFENGLEAMLLLDDSGTIIEANTPAGVVFACPSEELPGRALPDLVNPAAGRVLLRMWLALRRHGALAGEYKYAYANGTTGDFEYKCKADFLPHYHLVLIRDVTARNRAEAEHLAREAADRANRSKSEFLSNMSHELRTPLNAVLGFAQLLALDELTDEQTENVGYILKAGQHLLGLIKDVLDIARIEYSPLSISAEPVLLADVLNQCIELAAPLAAGRKIQMRLEDADALLESYVLADHQRLSQVLLNLISNAIKYNRLGGTVLLRCIPVGEGRLRIAVHDTGLGISAAQMSLLFRPFERLGAEHTTIEGTGLGLALSKVLAEAMGGTLGVESVLDQGSTFWIELQTVVVPSYVLAAKGTGPLVLPQDQQVNHTVLYIEDNPASLQLVARIIEQLPSVTLLSSHSGLGIELARQNKIDLILLDIHLPDINGDEALRRLKADPKTRPIPVVVISADATPNQINQMLNAGAYAYLTKPLDVKQFLRMLHDVFQDEAP